MEMLSAYKKEFANLEKFGARKAALEEFLSAGFPTPKTEDWRYVDLKLLRSGHLIRTQTKVSNPKVSPIAGWPLLVIENGQITQSPENLAGLKILEDGKGLAEKGLFDSPLERLNLALVDRTFVLKVEKGANIEGLEIVFLNTSKKDEALYLRNLIEIEEGAKANIFIRTEVKNSGTWTNQITNITLGKNSKLNLIRDFEAPDGALITARDFASLEKGAIFRAPSLLAGLSSIRYEIEASLAGATAHADLSGGMLAGENNTIDVLTRVHHAAGETTSNQTFKGVAGAKGSTAFQSRMPRKLRLTRTVIT